MDIIPLKNIEIDAIVGILKNDGAVVVPTDTVYGLAANAKSKIAVEKVLAIKGRPAGKPLPIFVSSFAMLPEVADARDERILKILRKVWPGKVTCVLNSRGWLPLALRGKEGLTIGIRIPDYPWLWKIMEKLGGPVTATSANVSGYPPHTRIKEIIEEFEKLPLKPDLIVDAGDLVPSEPSAVLDFTIYPPEVLRGDKNILNDL
jgi:L-threonylcarbamoyladenylate synthase